MDQTDAFNARTGAGIVRFLIRSARSLRQRAPDSRKIFLRNALRLRPYLLSSMLVPFGLCMHQTAQAVTCATFSSPGWSATYDPNVVLATSTSSSVTVTCTRQKGDTKNVTLTVAANSGMQPAGAINLAKAPSGSLLQYNDYTDAAYTLIWGTGGSTLPVPLAFGGVGSTATATVAFYARIPAGQVGVTAGLFTDIVSLTLNNGATAVSTTTFPVTVTVNANCAISTPPGAVTLNYTSFQNTPATGSTTFAATCTNALPYTLSLDATSGTLLGLTYTLSVPAGTYTGTGLPQSYVINGAIAAGQAGTCATATCTGTATRTLTITY